MDYFVPALLFYKEGLITSRSSPICHVILEKFGSAHRSNIMLLADTKHLQHKNA